MPALVPRTVIMIAAIEQYSQRQAHFELQQGRVIQYVLCLLSLVWVYGWAGHFSHNEEAGVTCAFVIKKH